MPTVPTPFTPAYAAPTPSATTLETYTSPTLAATTTFANPNPTFAAVASDLEAALASQVARENALVEAKTNMTSAAAGEVRRLEQERNVFLGQLSRLKSAAAEEEAETEALLARADALRRELTALRGAEAAHAGALDTARTHRAAAGGVLSALAAAAEAAGIQVEGLSHDVRAIIARAGLAELGAVRLDAAAAQLGGVAAGHAAGAGAAEGAERVVRAATQWHVTRARALEVEKTACETRLESAGVFFAAASDRLKVAEANLAQQRARHMQR